MQDTRAAKARIELDSISQLFNVEVFDPFDPTSRWESGIDSLVDQIKGSDGYWQIEIVLRQPLPKKMTAKQVTQAVRRYAQEKMKADEKRLKLARAQGLHELRWAFGFVIVLIGLLVLLEQFIHDFYGLGGYVVGFAGIVIWVVLWPGLDNLLYEWQPYRLDWKAYNSLLQATINVVTEKHIQPAAK